MGDVKNCSAGEINANIESAAATKQMYGAVEILLTGQMKNSDGTWTIRFSVQGDPTGKTYEANWGDTAHMWAPCPSTFPSAATPGAPGAPPANGAFGRLYLSKPFVEFHDIAAEPKWPPTLPVTAPPSNELSIYPLKLELTGIEMKSGRFRKATVDLLDARYAASKQKLELDGSSPVKVRLTQAAFTKFRLIVPSMQAVRAALAVLKGHAKSAEPEIAAWSVIAAAAAYAASGGRLDDELSKELLTEAGAQLEKLVSAA